MKRGLDVVASLAGLVVLSPVLVVVAFLIWRGDGHSPFYVAPRAGRGGRPFRMFKFRSMRMGADRSGVDSTSASDTRITDVGRWIRAYKIDEVPQLWNVLNGEMSLVGPRPQVLRDAEAFTAEERHLLDVRPGITDFASIVFADEAQILDGAPDADLAYHQLIRPWKSRLALFYARHHSLRTDLTVIWLTLQTIVSRDRALRNLGRELERLGVDETLRRVAGRTEPLQAAPPPGATALVTSREGAI